MKVRANTVYVYRPCLLDVTDGRTNLTTGTKVRVRNLRGCPPCNAMGHAHIVHPETGEYIGLVCTASLSKEYKPKKDAQFPRRSKTVRVLV